MRNYIMKRNFHGILGALALCLLAVPLGAAPHGDDAVRVDGLTFETWEDYAASDYFKSSERRCATPSQEIRQQLYGPPTLPLVNRGVLGDPVDCSQTATNPTSDYDPNFTLEIPVVVHIIMNTACTDGVISDEMVESQIEILNEDFQAIMGTNGGDGNNAEIRFVLADTDPMGDPTTGITRSCNTTWFNDGGSYWNTLAWDPNNYMNVYTNRAGGNLGYVPFLPADSGGAFVGGNSDRVVVLWDSFGRSGPIGPPYNQGRTGTHEVGHYLGLEHTFSGGCATATPPGCYSSGDLICDTNSEASPTFSPCAVGDSVSCGSVNPSDNYMDYSDDLCMMQFTVEQNRRMRCTLEHYRPDLANVGASDDIFTDGFESGDTTSWGSVIP